MWHDHGRVSPVPLEIERQPEDCSDDLSIEGLVVHELRWRDRLWREARYSHVGNLLRLLSGNVVHPQVTRSVHGLMLNQDLPAIGRELLRTRSCIDARR